MFNKFDGEIIDKVAEFEQIVKMDLPKDYKDFLLDTNGGQFVDEVHTFWVEELKDNIGIDVLFGFDRERSLCLNSWYNEYEEELPENTVIIGNSINAGLIILIWQEDWQGVFLWDHCLNLEQSTEEDCLIEMSKADALGLYCAIEILYTQLLYELKGESSFEVDKNKQLTKVMNVLKL